MHRLKMNTFETCLLWETECAHRDFARTVSSFSSVELADGLKGKDIGMGHEGGMAHGAGKAKPWTLKVALRPSGVLLVSPWCSFSMSALAHTALVFVDAVPGAARRGQAS